MAYGYGGGGIPGTGPGGCPPVGPVAGLGNPMFIVFLVLILLLLGGTGRGPYCG